MEIEVAACRSSEEVPSALVPVWHYFGGGPFSEDDLRRFKSILEPSRAIAAHEAGTVVGGAASYPFELTVPGGSVRAAGVTVVGVMPTHRRRGILRQMMRVQLDDIHHRGEPVAYLWASEDTIYGRFGYGMASVAGNVDIPKSSNAFVLPTPGRSELQLVNEADALEPFSRIYDRVRTDQPGMFARSENWWRFRRFADPESRRQGGGVLNRVLLTIDGRPEGYALYRIHQSFDSGTSAGHVNVIEAVGATPAATRDLWRFLLDIDWVASVKAQLLPLDHALWFLIARPREMKFQVRDGVWVRLVDVPAALAARALSGADPVVIEVADAFCPWNQGRYRVAAGSVERTTADADLALDVTALGTVYLGGFTFGQLVRSARIEERRPGAATRADALFTADRAPWCPEIF